MISLPRFLAATVLGASLACSFSTGTAFADNKTLTWVGCGISKKAFMSEIAAAYEKKTGVKIKLQGGGATKGIRQVSSKTVDLGGACRHTIDNPTTISPISEERLTQMTPVAWDALAVLVHKDNPVDTISLNQIRDLYTGKITNWKQLGGKDAPVELYVRKGRISGVGRTVRELIFANYEQEFVATHVVKSSGPLEKGIVKNVNGIGISGVSSARKRDVKLLKLEGKEPSYEHIKNGSYLLYRPLYIVTHLQNRDPEVHKFLDYIYSEEGKEIIRSVGTVPYEDAIKLWVKYIEQQQRALAAGLS
jgi:phosphate transport system substrate-binding protein